MIRSGRFEEMGGGLVKGQKSSIAIAAANSAICSLDNISILLNLVD